MSDGPCEEVLREIEDLIRQGQDPLADQAIAVHLRDCWPCDHVEFERRLKQILSVKCRGDSVPVSLEARIRAVVRETPPEQTTA